LGVPEPGLEVMEGLEVLEVPGLALELLVLQVLGDPKLESEWEDLERELESELDQELRAAVLIPGVSVPLRRWLLAIAAVWPHTILFSTSGTA
jgi:hypothetical protein